MKPKLLFFLMIFFMSFSIGYSNYVIADKDNPNNSFLFVESSTGDVIIGGTQADGSLLLDVNGQVGAGEYCDHTGNNCFNATDVGGAQNLFSTFDTPSGTDPVADTTTDAITFTASGAITITGNSGSDTITFDVTEVDGSTTNELQYLWDVFTADSGSTTANSQTDTLTIAGGTGISTSISGDTLTITSSVTDTDNQNLFQTFNVPSGTNPVADDANDTLNFAAGSGITITGDSSTDTITFDVAEVDGSTTNELQNLWYTVLADTGSAIANDLNDTLTIIGGTGISTSISGDTLTINSTIGGGVTGAGTTNYVAIWNSSGIMDDEGLYFDPTTNRLGIGTNLPQSKIEVVSNTTADENLAVSIMHQKGVGSVSFTEDSAAALYINSSTSMNAGSNLIGSGRGITIEMNPSGSVSQSSYSSIGLRSSTDLDNLIMGSGGGLFGDISSYGIYALQEGVIDSTSSFSSNEYITISSIIGIAEASINDINSASTLEINKDGGYFSSASVPSPITQSTTTMNVHGVRAVVSDNLGTTGLMTKYGLKSQVSGTADTNYGLYLETYGATVNYDVYANNSLANNYFAGNVGIGVSNPQAMLHVGNGTPGNATGFGDLYVTSDIEYDGNLYGGGADLVEMIEVSEEGLKPGDVVELDPNNYGKVRKSRGAYSKLVAGIVSTDPGIVLGKDTKGVELALSGRVPVKINDENGPIKVGDLLTSSSVPGEAMRCVDADKCFGSIIGKAMETGTKGEILALVTLG